jgi:hypothetical protein
MYTNRTTAQVIALRHTRAEKSPLLDPDLDVLHERRRAHRMVDSFTWVDVTALVALGIWNVSALLGIAWLIGRFLASLEAGVWL